MTKEKILETYNKLKKLGDLKGVKFAYAIAKNLSVLEREVKAIQESVNPSPEYSKYQEERLKLAKDSAKKDESGKAITFIDENGIENYAIADQAKFDKEFETLKKKHKKAIDEMAKQEEEFRELLKTDSSIELHKIDFNDVPKEISVSQMEAIKDIVKE